MNIFEEILEAFFSFEISLRVCNSTEREEEGKGRDVIQLMIPVVQWLQKGV